MAGKNQQHWAMICHARFERKSATADLTKLSWLVRSSSHHHRDRHAILGPERDALHGLGLC